MEFFKCSIGGEVYGTGMTEIEIGGAQRNGMKVEQVFRIGSVMTMKSLM